jgi:sugar lactone lactonase YvrE
VTVDPSGKFVYVANSGSNTVSGFMIDSNGALISLGNPFSLGNHATNPRSVAVDPSGKFVYVANLGTGNVSGFTIASNGALTLIAGSPFTVPGGRVPPQPRSVAVDPSGKFVYVANQNKNNVSGFTIDAVTGALTAITGSPFTTGSFPVSVAVDPSGKFVYVANSQSNNVSGYTIETTGALTSLGNAFTAGSSPFSVAITPASPPPCTAQSTNSSNFNGTPIQGGDFIWFNANFTAKGIPSSGATLFFQNSTISFTADKAYNVPVPNSQITFSPSATCSSISFNSLTNTWMITVPVSGSDEIFLSGLTFPVPTSFANVNGKVSGPVAWTGTFGTNIPGVSMQWKWGAALYTCFPSDYNLLNVKPTHQNACNLNNGDHAGTPENRQFQQCLIGGARGGGGSNFTGSWSGTLSVSPVCP